MVGAMDFQTLILSLIVFGTQSLLLSLQPESLSNLLYMYMYIDLHVHVSQTWNKISPKIKMTIE